MDNQIGFNMSEIQPVVENISFDSTFIDDQGDIFHCGKCKLNFNSFIDFISHKKEHTSQSFEKVSPHSADLEATDEKMSQIWVWNPGTVATDQVVVSSSETVAGADPPERSPTPPNPAGGSKPPKSLLTCSICQKQFKKQFSFFLHLRSHSGEKPFQCIICGRTFPQKSNVKKHLLTHRVWPDGLGNTVPENALEDGLGYSCKFCPAILKTHPELKQHLNIHNNRKVYKCIQNKCKAMYDDVDSLLNHLKTGHETVEYHCHMCPATLNSLEDMTSHQRQHAASKTDVKSNHKYKCVLCNKFFKKHEDLTYHLATAEHVNKCSHCDKSFTTERALRRHLLLHDSNKSFKCDVCGLSFRKKQYLCSHLATHSKERDFVCNICGSSFGRKDMLMRHVKIHQPNKRLQCPFRTMGCTMDFTRSDKLKLHIKSHTKKINGKKKNEKTKSKKLPTNQESFTTVITYMPLSTTTEDSSIDSS